METSKPLMNDENAEDVDDSPFYLEAYSDSDYAGASLDRKSTTRGCQFLGSRLISWQCKKQTVVSNSTTEAEYVAVASCCGQISISNSAKDEIQVSDVGLTFFWHIRYALTENPTIYVSLIKQFWETATARTLDTREVELTATIDSKVKIITEASVRRHLQLADSDGISSLPNTEIFEQLSLMGNMKRASKGYSGENIPLFSTMIVQGPVVQGEGSTHRVESHHIPTNAPSTSQPLISPTSRRTIKQESVVPQPRSPTQTHIADEAASTGVDLIKKVKKLENKVKSNQARRRARIIVSDDEEDLEDPSKQGRKISKIDQDPTILLDVSTAEEDISTTKTVSTAGAAVTTASVDVSTVTVSTAKDKGKGIMKESEPVQTKTKLQQEQERLGYEAALRLQAELEEEERQRITSVQEEASSFNIEEWDDIQARVEADEELAQRLQAEEREKYSKVGKARLLAKLVNQRKTYTLQQLRSYSFDKIKNLFEITMRRVHTFVPMDSVIERAIPDSTAGSSKRDAEEELAQEKQGMNVEALQTKYPIIDWEIYTEGARKYWKIIRVGNHTKVYQFFDDMLKAFDKEDLVKLWSLVKEKFNSTEPTEDKEREIWVELKRLFKLDTYDELWKLQKYIHNLTWRLYDSCRVHHVSTEKGIDIYMLIENEYPLSRGTLTQMLVAKLLVEQDNQMSRELLRKIFMQVERPRR
ncbi:hypothetical protein Tco_0013619 [Tanacetum coccineum]